MESDILQQIVGKRNEGEILYFYSYKKMNYDSKIKEIKLSKVEKRWMIGLKSMDCSGEDCIEPYKKEVNY